MYTLYIIHKYNKINLLFVYFILCCVVMSLYYISFCHFFKVIYFLISISDCWVLYLLLLLLMKLFTTRLSARFSHSIVLNYQDLKAGKNLEDAIEKAYGPKGHGILFVDGIPDFVEIRKATLPLFTKLANLPENVLKQYMRPQIYHSLGWSCGVQQFQGKYDTSKGSYYINCSSDNPQPISEKDKKHYTPEQIKMNVGNIWVKQIPELQKNVKALSKTMIDTGILLSRQIDSYVHKNVKTYPKDLLNRIISTGNGHIGRVLHYFPFENKGEAEDDWCGWHNDHGSLTALTSAMYNDAAGNQIPLKGKSGGLYAQNRFTEMARILIPSHMCAFQLGQSTQIHTGGYLEATPHCVVRNQEIAGKKIGRDTFALFMQPNHLQVMKTPDGIPAQKAKTKAYKIPQLKDRWDNGIFFKQFHQRTIKHYS